MLTYNRYQAYRYPTNTDSRPAVAALAVGVLAVVLVAFSYLAVNAYSSPAYADDVTPHAAHTPVFINKTVLR